MNLFTMLARLMPFLLIITSAARAGTIDPSTADSKYVEFGQRFPFVIRICAAVSDKDPKTGIEVLNQHCASAVVIRPNWVLTAAHVVHNAKSAVVTTDDKQVFPLHKILPHKDYKYENASWHDIALCYTPEPIKLEFYPELYEGVDEVNQAVTIAGWGMTGTFHSGAVKFDGKRRAGHNKLESAFDGTLVCAPTRGRDRFPLEFMISPGDSGGGMFIGNKLAGINSFLMAVDKKPDGTYSDESVFTRVSLYANWVELQIEKHELALQGRATTSSEPATP